MKDIIIYGASGHARVIIDIVEQSKVYNIVGLVDDTGSVIEFMGYPVYRDIAKLYELGVRAGLIAVGDNWQRARLAALVSQNINEFDFISCVHPSARVGRDVVIGKGSVVMAGCNINPQVTIGSHCIVNTGANVDHDCILGDCSSVAPGATLGGNVTVGDYTAIGLSAAVIQKTTIGANVVIGAGAVVVKNVPSSCVAYGNPCRVVRKRQVGEPYL